MNATQRALRKEGFLLNTSRAIVFANGELPHPEAFRALLRPDDVLIAADGGLEHLLRLGLQPNLIVGDLDSAPAEAVGHFSRQGVRVLRYPSHKDETDLELALAQAVAEGARQVLIAAALGGRLDQTLGNLALLAGPRLVGLDVRLEDGREEVFLIRSSAALEGRPGDVVSLLPWGGPAKGVETQGLLYPLHFETLYPTRTRGVSNVMSGTRAQVSLASGMLICVHTRGEA